MNGLVWYSFAFLSWITHYTHQWLIPSRGHADCERKGTLSSAALGLVLGRTLTQPKVVRHGLMSRPHTTMATWRKSLENQHDNDNGTTTSKFRVRIYYGEVEDILSRQTTTFIKMDQQISTWVSIHFYWKLNDVGAPSCQYEEVVKWFRWVSSS